MAGWHVLPEPPDEAGSWSGDWRGVLFCWSCAEWPTREYHELLPVRMGEAMCPGCKRTAHLTNEAYGREWMMAVWGPELEGQ